MNYYAFLDEVIDSGISGARADYSDPDNSNHAVMLKGAVAGFEACRKKVPQELTMLLTEAGVSLAKAFHDNADNYWEVKTYHAEICWVCNVISAMLINEGQQPIITPTVRGVVRAAQILDKANESNTPPATDQPVG